MRITCPACNASYDVPEIMLGRRQAVCCARCAEEWVPSIAAGDSAWTAPSAGGLGPVGQDAALGAPVGPDDTGTALTAEFEPSGEATAEPAAGSRVQTGPIPNLARPGSASLSATPAPGAGTAMQERRPADSQAWLGWLGSVVLLCGLTAGMIFWRGGVERTWPPSIRLYAALGLR